MPRNLKPTPEFLDQYTQYVEEVAKPLELTVRGILSEWRRDGYWASYAPEEGVAAPEPVQRHRTRLKRPEAVLDKLRRLKGEFPAGPKRPSLERMRDFVGGRIVTYFLSHIRMVDQEIRSGKHFEVVHELPPRSYLPRSTMERVGLAKKAFEIKGVKPSGYASIHYFVRLLDANREPVEPIFELQVRTMLEDVWAEVEHQLAYKPEKRAEFSVSRQFRVIGNHLSAIDDHFDYLSNRLAYLQGLSDPQPSDLLNEQNLPRVLEMVECSCEQGEIAGLLDIMDGSGIQTVEDFHDRARNEIVEAIKTEYSSVTGGKVATAFHLVSTIIWFSGRGTIEEAKQVLRRNLAMVELTSWTRSSKGQAPPRLPEQDGASQ